MALRRIPVPLTDEERKNFGEALAHEVQRLELVKEQNKSVRATLKEEEDLIEAEIHRLARLVDYGSEERELDVEEFHDHQVLKVIVKSVETGAVLLTRDMTQEEMDAARSPGLPFTDGVPANGNGSGASMTGPPDGADVIDEKAQRYPAKAKKRSERGKPLRTAKGGKQDAAAAPAAS